MATITLKNVADSLHERLNERAERNRRSLDKDAGELHIVAELVEVLG